VPYFCYGDVTNESVPGGEDLVKDITPIVPEEPKIGLSISSTNEMRLPELNKSDEVSL
jgi:hypothetical protein